MAAAATGKRPTPPSEPQQPATIPPPLTFPRPIFAALSPHPFLRAHLVASAQGKDGKKGKPLRANNRTPTECRTPQVHVGSLTHSNGSAVVRLGNTVAVCGVRAEILKVEVDEEIAAEEGDFDAESDLRELEDLRLLVPNVEVSTGSTPLLVPGNAPSAFQQSLTTRLRNLLLSTHVLRAADLRIVHTTSAAEEGEAGDGMPEGERMTVVKGHWVLYIDTLFISLDGNAFDAAWLGILAALRTARIPRAYFDEEFEGILCSDAPAEASPLKLYGLPVPNTFAVFEARAGLEGPLAEGEEEGRDLVLSDPDAFEESVCKERVCVVVDCSEGEKAIIRRVEKSGGGVVERAVLRGLVERARANWAVWRDVLAGV